MDPTRQTFVITINHEFLINPLQFPKPHESQARFHKLWHITHPCKTASRTCPQPRRRSCNGNAPIEKTPPSPPARGRMPARADCARGCTRRQTRARRSQVRRAQRAPKTRILRAASGEVGDAHGVGTREVGSGLTRLQRNAKIEHAVRAMQVGTGDYPKNTIETEKARAAAAVKRTGRKRSRRSPATRARSAALPVHGPHRPALAALETKIDRVVAAWGAEEDGVFVRLSTRRYTGGGARTDL